MSLWVYSSSVEADARLTAWWLQLHASGDLARAWHPSAHALHGFLGTLQPPNVTLWDADAEGVAFVAWFEPTMDGAAMGAWVRPALRTTRRGLAYFLEAWDWALARWPVILGYTKQEALIRQHTRVGYAVCGCVPALWGGEPVWVLALTRARFAAARARFERPGQLDLPLEALQALVTA